MAKIDLTAIPGYSEMTAEQKLAALEALDVPDMTGYVKKDLFDKATSEAAGYKKQLREKMSHDEQVAAQQAETLKSLQDELDGLRAEKTVSDYARRWQSVGYAAALAEDTARAMVSGDMETVFKNHALFVAEHDKALKADLLKHTPTPPAGDGSKGITREEFSKLSLAEKAKFAQENPTAYNEFYGGR